MIGSVATVSAQPMYAEERVDQTLSSAEENGRETAYEQSDLVMETTGFAGRIVWFLRTPTADVSLRVAAENEAPPTVGEQDEGDRANRDRLVFLSRKYADRKFSAEANARLEILTERIRHLIPRVTTSDLEALETVAGDLAAIKNANSAVDKELDEIERGG